eukprot:TRINITY_DN20452_c0_g1_i7.p1 TRINITY_DN20452_c0_g1~~TRINITY_DN20452_c0_g1_i7.p1  ORF type:complete len:454 (-),score=47.20 TRINITY_DN20452_c0_g1_i7:60-1421(-)
MENDVTELCEKILSKVSKEQALDVVRKLYTAEVIQDRRIVLGNILYLLDSTQDDQEDVGISWRNTRIVQDYVWEKLNTGHWKEVWIGWRKIYAVAALIRILNATECLLKQIRRNNKEVKEAVENKGGDFNKRKLIQDTELGDPRCSPVLEDLVKLADMGLLLGAPVLKNILEHVAQEITQYLSLEFSESDTKVQKTLVPDFNLEDVAVKLPQGCQHLEELKCIEEPSMENFIINYKAPEKPAIISGALSDWPAVSGPRKWTVPYLVRVAGPRTVPIEIGKNYTSEHWTQRLMTVKQFAEQYLQGDCKEVGYLAQHQLLDQVPALAEDICIPDLCFTGEEDDVDMNVWIGPKGTVSPLHTDPKHNFLCQVSGSKYVVLYPSTDSKYLYPHPTPLLFNTSRVDLQNVNLEEHPDFCHAKGYHALLKAGQMLYIPPGMWHFVKSLETSFSVSFWWQ